MKIVPNVSIIFPNYNGGKEPIECLKSISELNYPKNRIETIVIDNNSTDGSYADIKRLFPWVKLIRLKQNIGFARAINKGIQLASGKYLIIANDDILFSDNSIKYLVEYAYKNPQIGVLGGKIYSKKNRKLISSAGYMMNRWTGNIYCAPDTHRIKQPDWIQGCALFIPKYVIDIVGNFDTKFNHFFEDFDLCLRVKKTGYQVIYLPYAVFWHGESTTADKNKPLKYFNWYCNKYRFIIKNFPLINIFSIIFIQFFFITPYRAIILKDGRFIPFLKATWWLINNLRIVVSARYLTSR